MHEGRTVGAALFRKPSLPKTAACYGATLELARLVMLDEAERNSESRFLGFMLRALRRVDRTLVCVSYADPLAGHDGTIYRASNWTYVGLEKGHGTRRIIVDGERLHSKTAYDRWGCSGSKLKEMLHPREVRIEVCPPKHVYTYAVGGAR